jgi:hypothetical protein
MLFFPKKTILTAGLLSAVTMVGVYSATAGGSALGQRPSLATAHVAAKVESRNDKVVRIVGPPFFPDNGDIKLLGAAKERARRG